MKLITLFSLLICLTTYAQDKKRYFYDENDVAISEAEFARKIDYKVNIDRVFTSDTAVIGKLYIRRAYGELEPQAIEYLREYLTAISGKELDSTAVILIKYFPGKGEEKNEKEVLNKHGYYKYSKKYKKKLNKITPNEQFWISNSENLKKYHKKIKWIYDSTHYIENTFFPIYFDSGSFVIIHPNGKYIRFYSEYGIDQVLEAAKELVRLYEK